MSNIFKNGVNINKNIFVRRLYKGSNSISLLLSNKSYKYLTFYIDFSL